MAFGYTISATLEVFLEPVDDLVALNLLFFSETVIEYKIQHHCILLIAKLLPMAGNNLHGKRIFMSI